MPPFRPTIEFVPDTPEGEQLLYATQPIEGANGGCDGGGIVICRQNHTHSRGEGAIVGGRFTIASAAVAVGQRAVVTFRQRSAADVASPTFLFGFKSVVHNSDNDEEEPDGSEGASEAYLLLTQTGSDRSSNGGVPSYVARAEGGGRGGRGGGGGGGQRGRGPAAAAAAPSRWRSHEVWRRMLPSTNADDNIISSFLPDIRLSDPASTADEADEGVLYAMVIDLTPDALGQSAAEGSGGIIGGIKVFWSVDGTVAGMRRVCRNTGHGGSGGELPIVIRTPASEGPTTFVLAGDLMRDGTSIAVEDFVVYSQEDTDAFARTVYARL